jgi:hypothetical protein
MVSLRIRIQYFSSMGIRIQGFDDQKLENSYKSLDLHKERPSFSTGEGFSSQNGTFSTSNHEILKKFLFL